MNIHLVVDDELAGRIDAVRGDLPRVRWIRQAINEKLAGPIDFDPPLPIRATPEALKAWSAPLPPPGTPRPTAADVAKGIAEFAQNHPKPRVLESRPSPDECTHPYRDNLNRCRVCGHQR